MELIKISAINETWKLCTLAGFLGLFLLTLLVTTTNPPTFQISISTTTFNEVSSPTNAATPPLFMEAAVVRGALKGGESYAKETTYNHVSSLEDKMFESTSSTATNATAGHPEYETPAVQSNYTNTSEAAFLQLVNSSGKVFSSPEVIDPITAPTTTTTGAGEYEIPTNETNYSNASNTLLKESSFNDSVSLEEKMFGSTPEVLDPITNSTPTGAGEYEIATNETNYSNSSNNLFKESSFNASTSLEDKLFGSTSEVVDLITTTTNSTTGTVEYEIPTGETNNYNSSPTEEEKLLISAPAPPGPTGEKKCRMYEGRWVYKPQENPGYHVYQCPFLEDKMSCRKNGRPDSDYEGWGWESDGCQIPLFNGTYMLERLRGKRMIISGDSLNRNMWESLACLLYTSIAPHRTFVDAGGPAYKVLKAMDYEFTLEFYWAPFLVHLDETHKSGRKVLSLDKMVPFSEQWRGADVMVFNSGHWWTHHGKLKAWDVFEYDGEQVEEMENELAYERALTTWAQWVAHNVDPNKTKIYFRSISPEHKGKQWCFNHTQPMAADELYYQMYPRSMTDVVERKILEANARDGVVGVRYLNITGLSSTRIEAHPSIYRFKHWKVITEKYKRLLKSKSDCSHWCLPGLPDTWNRILYASLFFDHLSPGDLSTS